MCTLADMAEMPRQGAVEFLQKEAGVAEILQVNSKSLVLPKIHIFSPTGFHSRSSSLQVPSGGVVQRSKLAEENHAAEGFGKEGGEDSEERKQLHHEDEGEKGTKADETVPAERNCRQWREALSCG